MQNIQSNLIQKTVSEITSLNQNVIVEAKKYQASLAIPPDSLGELLEIGSRLAGITGKLHNALPKKRIIVLAADNGITEEGVSSAPKSVTASQAVNMTKRLTGMSALAKHFGNEVQVVDVGIECDYNYAEILNKKLRKGTNSFLRGAAMEREEAIRAIEIGIELAASAKSDGVSVLGVGEMGIGNTTTSTAVLSVLTGANVDEITGRGGGITDEMFSHKKEVIKKGIAVNNPDKNDVIDVLSKVGGFDLAAMCGVFLGAAKNKLPVVIDGYISAVSALCAARICPPANEYFFPSHCSEEAGYKIAINELSLVPYLNLKMRLGEGSGCPLAFEIMDAACTIMNDVATFKQAKINDAYLEEVRNEHLAVSNENYALITGGCKNGKSSFAESLACHFAKKNGAKPIYFATMLSHDSEDDTRIQKHRESRKNLGFETIECGKNISDFAEKIKGRVVLFDSLTALVQNEMFEGRTDLKNLLAEEEKIRKKLQAELSVFLEKASAIVFVSDTITRDGKIYEETTELYRRILAKTENFLAKKCEVHEMTAGIGNEKDCTPHTAHCSLIIGGSYQGKAAFAKKEFSLSDDEICVCTLDSAPNFSKRCISHYENYVAFCLKNGIEPKTDFSDSYSANGNGKIIICDDIFCGVVPIDPFQRKLREKCGLALQKIAKNSEIYRVFCGIAEKL